MTKANILIVEDEAIVAAEIKISLENMGYSVASIARRGEESIDKAKKIRPDLILMDIQLKGEMDGIKAAGIIQSRFGIPVVFLTAYDDDERLKRAKFTRPYGYTPKPFQDRELRIAIEMALYASDMDARRESAEEALRERTKDLNERVKELDCLYSISNLIERPNISPNEVMQGIVDLIPSSLQYPELACSRIVLENGTFKTENFRETTWKLSIDFFAQGKRVGEVEVCYLEEAPEIEGLFLKEETELIRAIAERLGHIVGRMRAKEKQERLEAQLQQTHKMDAIAILAGGVAHEFNNALMGVYGNIDLLQMNAGSEKKVRKYSETIKISSHRMAELTNQLLAYARGGKYQPKTVWMVDFMNDSLPIMLHRLNQNIRVETDLPKDISAVKADTTQLQMILSALLANANEAVGSEGRIRITLKNEDLGKDMIGYRPGFRPGSYVCLQVEDDGKGMDEETRDRIFDPFFTTKFQGRGMGMAAVYGIVQNHDGMLRVESEPGKGTVIRVWLPAIDVAPQKLEPAGTEAAVGIGTILLIEDEEMVIEVTQAMLDTLGYRVVVAKTGEEAVRITETFDGRIDLALLDIKLPDMEGGKLYPLIMEARPHLKVIVCSGYNIDGPAQEIIDAGARGFLHKPFSVITLSEKVKEVLEEKQFIGGHPHKSKKQFTLCVLQF